MKSLLFLLTLVILVGGGCANYPAGVDTSPQTTSTPVTAPPDIRADWKTVQVGGVVSFQIPAHCLVEGAAGTTYITCPEPGEESVVPEFTVSSDGITVSFRRWEGLESAYWDNVIESIQVITPLTHDIEIHIAK